MTSHYVEMICTECGHRQVVPDGAIACVHCNAAASLQPWMPGVAEIEELQHAAAASFYATEDGLDAADGEPFSHEDAVRLARRVAEDHELLWRLSVKHGVQREDYPALRAMLDVMDAEERSICSGRHNASEER